MEKFKEEVEKFLPEVEKFLTSVLLEETDITIADSESKEKDVLEEECQKEDVYIYTRDEKLQAEFIIVFDKVWFGLLSSIMLGVEEKTNNEITRDLLTKFYGDMYESLLPKMKESGYDPSLEDVQIFTKTQLLKKFSHTEYFHITMEVAGLADNKVRAEILAGNPEALIQEENKAGTDLEVDDEMKDMDSEDSKDDGAAHSDFKESEFDTTDDEPGESKTVAKEQVISGRNVEFEEFLEQPIADLNGDSRSMDLLRDVEMDVSVELGRIELPLGKVLQLTKGSVIELEKLAGEPVDILVNGHNIAKGEVVVIDEHFGVRISSLVTTRQRLANMS